MSDAETLRLAHPEINEAKLADFLAAAGPNGEFDADQLKARAMKPSEAHKILAAVQAFVSPRRVARRLDSRLSVARKRVQEATGAGRPAPPREIGLLASIPPKREALLTDQALRDLYSAETVEVLRAHEAELVERFGAG